MDLASVIDSELRALSAEARKDHPAVKEAVERALLKLRDVRKTDDYDLRRLRTSEFVRPFLLACNHPKAIRRWSLQP